MHVHYMLNVFHTATTIDSLCSCFDIGKLRQKLSQYCKLITESNYFLVMNEVQEALILYTKCYRYLYFNSNSSKNNCS